MIPRSICDSSVNSYSEAVVRRCSVKKVLEILENSHENTCARGSFLIYLQTSTLLKKRLRYRCFPVNFAKFLRTTFFYETPPVAASGHFTEQKHTFGDVLQNSCS